MCVNLSRPKVGFCQDIIYATPPTETEAIPTTTSLSVFVSQQQPYQFPPLQK